MSRPAASIVIPCFNGEAWLQESLQSVFEQGLTDCLEIILVDDGSTDGSAELIQKEFPSVRLIQIDHSGSSHARNVGTRSASGEFIQYLDVDDVLVPGKIAIQIQALTQTGGDVAYGGWQELIRDGGDHFRPGWLVDTKIRGNAEIALFTDFWCPPAVYLFRRKVVEEVGGWNERLPIIQDARFVLDCALRGGRFTYCHGLMAYYRVHSSGSVSTRDAVQFVRDCFVNATEVEVWWRSHGGINEERKQALLKAYGHVARASFEKDSPTFEAAYEALKKLEPRYVPQGRSRSLAIASRILGYRRAEYIALCYRRTKKILGEVTSFR